ncbi:MAG TPA: histidine kinase dimerization/phospho-acceptor domain-containing protein, partial [Bryobacteraceae bacterium]|nr:histidine kinase dimerization/phospho-acceptor domain-containing protein [Bryobacteraceae bacterium]
MDILRTIGILGLVVGPLLMVGFVHFCLRKIRATTERMATKEALQQRFFGQLSHEVRNPLNGILGATGLLMSSDLTPEQRETLAMIRGSAQGLLNLLENVVDYGALAHDKLRLHPEPV